MRDKRWGKSESGLTRKEEGIGGDRRTGKNEEKGRG